MKTSPKLIYAIIDMIAEDIIGTLITQNNDAGAIRIFNDVASDPQSWVHKHPEDYILVELGTLTGETTIIPNQLGHRVVVTGQAWKELNNPDKPNGQTNA